jgi:peroxisomal membrane protein 4
MIFLFRSGTVREKIELVFKATRKHALNLARFATIYKLSMIALRNMGATPGKEGPYDTFFAGLLGGYLIFGQRNPKTGKISNISQQIVIYVFARVVLAIAKLSVRPDMGIIKDPVLSKSIGHNAWPVFAAVSWASVMYVFRWHPETIQSSLQSSMHYIYVDSNEWDGLKTLLWQNK